MNLDKDKELPGKGFLVLECRAQVLHNTMIKTLTYCKSSN